MEKVKITIIGSGQNVDRFMIENETNEYIKIIGQIPDGALNTKTSDLDLALLSACDLSFAVGYSKIIPTAICNNSLIVNLHGGILPKWRGFSSNAWAVMNGEKTIGYSLHRVTSTLDDGLLYFVKHIPIGDEETMSDVHQKMIDSIIRDCPEILYKISKGLLKGKQQCCADIAYCTRFDAQMGTLKDFSMPAQYYVNLYRCMAKPLGSGIYFQFKGNTYSVGKVEHGKKYGAANYLCAEGKIVNIEADSVWVKVRDSVIVLSDLQKNGTRVQPYACFKNGQRLGD